MSAYSKKQAQVLQPKEQGEEWKKLLAGDGWQAKLDKG